MTIILSLIIMVVTLRIHASISFSNFINDRLMESMDDLKESLVSEHRRYNGWDDLRFNPDRFRNIVESSIDDRRGGHEKYQPGRPPGPRPPHPDSHDFHGGPFPERYKRHEPESGRSMPPPMMGQQDLIDRISLFDADKTPLAGISQDADKNTLGELTDNGRIIGYLGIDKNRAFTEPRETGFIKQQFKAFYIIGFAVLILSALVSFILSRHLLSPVKGLIKGTQDVASFKFDTRIDVRTNDELGKLASDFNSMAMTLGKYENLRKQWISDISHELRTPLSVLQAEIEALEDGVRALDHKALSSLHGEISRLTKIVNDLHDLSLSDSGMLYFKMETVNPVAILLETLRHFEAVCKKQGVTLISKLNDQPTSLISGDGDRLKQMFSNILENALKYMTKPGSITFRQAARKNHLVLSIEDSGPGVPANSLPRLFDRFYRIESSRSRKLGGSGLGLSICKNIIETMGGGISARNTAEGGLGIDIELPLSTGGHRKS